MPRDDFCIFCYHPRVFIERSFWGRHIFPKEGIVMSKLFAKLIFFAAALCFGTVQPHGARADCATRPTVDCAMSRADQAYKRLHPNLRFKHLIEPYVKALVVMGRDDDAEKVISEIREGDPDRLRTQTKWIKPLAAVRVGDFETAHALTLDDRSDAQKAKNFARWAITFHKIGNEAFAAKLFAMATDLARRLPGDQSQVKAALFDAYVTFGDLKAAETLLADLAGLRPELTIGFSYGLIGLKLDQGQTEGLERALAEADAIGATFDHDFHLLHSIPLWVRLGRHDKAEAHAKATDSPGRQSLRYQIIAETTAAQGDAKQAAKYANDIGKPLDMLSAFLGCAEKKLEEDMDIARACLDQAGPFALRILKQHGDAPLDYRMKQYFQRLVAVAVNANHDSTIKAFSNAAMAKQADYWKTQQAVLFHRIRHSGLEDAYQSALQVEGPSGPVQAWSILAYRLAMLEAE